MRLSLRLGLILSAAFALVIAVVVTAFLAAQRDFRAYGVALPLPARTAAIVDLVESTRADELPVLLRALTTPELTVAVADRPPATRGVRPMRGMSLLLGAYLSAMRGRPLSAMVELEGQDRSPSVMMNNTGARASHPVRFLIGLRSGKTLVIEAHSALADRFTGLRLALFTLLATLAIAAISLWVVHRQLRPLEQLAKAVENFGTRLETSSIPEEGTQELRQLVAAFNRLQSHITLLIAGRSRMLAAISHDLGTYLTRLRLRAEYVSDPEQRERTVHDIEDMHALMMDTLVLAKLDHDGEPIEAVDLVTLANKIAQRFRGAGGKVLVRSSPVEVRAKVCPSIFGRVFDNLIANALRYGGEAEITVAAVDGAAEILVDDRGPGIPPSERDAVLEPFYRGDGARNLDEGRFGLGLSIVADIVARHAGSLAFEDRPGGGLRVRLRIPLAG